MGNQVNTVYIDSPGYMFYTVGSHLSGPQRYGTLIQLTSLCELTQLLLNFILSKNYTGYIVTKLIRRYVQKIQNMTTS